MDNLGDFFSLIGEEKKKSKEKNKEILGEVSLGDLFSSLSEEKRKVKEKNLKKEKELDNIKKDAKIFEAFLFNETPKVEQSAIKAVKVLETELVNLKSTSYKSIDRLMRGISAEYNITPTKLHNQFKEKHNLIPDDWVKQQKEEVDTSNWKDDYKPLKIETEDIITPEPLKPTEGLGSEIVSKEESTIDKTLEILGQLIPEEEQLNESETEMARMKREVGQLRKMFYQTIQKVEVQGGGGEVRLEFLDDVDRDSAKVNDKVLKYQTSTGKWVGADAGYAHTAGISTTSEFATNSSYAHVAGIATYATTAGVATNAQGLTGIPNIIVNSLTAQKADIISNINITGIATVGFISASNATISGIITSQSFDSLSDRRVKENIRVIASPLDKVSKLNGVHFDFINTHKPSMGVIAQEVEEVFPELIAGSFPKSVNYNGLIGLLIESVKELKDENELLKSRLDKLEAR
jgi:hypothetical protein